MWNGVMVKVMVVDLEKETVTPATTLRAYLTDTVDHFFKHISHSLDIPYEKLRCVREHYYNDLQLLTKQTATLKDAGFTKCSKVFIEYSGLEDESLLIFQDTRLHNLLDRYENTIRLRISLPPYIQEYIKKSNVSTRHNTQEAEMSHDIDEGIDETDQLSSVTSPLTTTANVDSSLSAYHKDACSSHTHPVGISHQERPSPEGQESPQNISQVIAGVSASSVQISLREDTSPGMSHDGTENWNLDDNVGTEWDSQVSSQHEECPRYFRAELQTNTDKTERTLIVDVDKRITLSSLKKELQQYVGTTADNFKVFRIYSNCQEVEVSRLSETLSTYNDDSKLIVKLGRALRKGEYRVKVYLLQINKEEVTKFLVEAILANGMTVLDSKKVILKEIKRECNMDAQLDRCRLRRKPWKNPTKIYQNNQVFGQDITLMANWEVFLEILDGPDPLTDSSMLSVYIRRWRPSTYTVDPLQEIILTIQTVDELRQKISSHSCIPAENVEFAKAKGTFPYEISLLEVHTEMDWNVSVTALNMHPLSISEDGAVVYFRDKTEQLMVLSDAKKKEIQQKENARLSHSSHCHYTPRKERALKIYTDDTVSQSASSISTSNHLSSTQNIITSSSPSLNSHPELD